MLTVLISCGWTINFIDINQHNDLFIFFIGIFNFFLVIISTFGYLFEND